MKSVPEVTVIILNYNGGVETSACLWSVLQTRYPCYKVILVDNGSKVNEAKILEKEFKDKRIKFVRFNKNWGYGQGHNLVLKDVKSKYVVFLNNDTEVDSNWLVELVKLAEKEPKIAACQPKIKSLVRKNFFDYAGAAGGFLDIFGYPFARGRLFDYVEEDTGQYDDPCDIFWASGTAMFVRRKALDEVGFFDKNFFAYAEEVDLCWRFHKVGLKVVYVPGACVYHHGGSTSNRNLNRKIFLVHRNHLLLLLKHYSVRELVLILLLRMVMELASILLYLIKGKPFFVFSVIFAWASLVLNVKMIFQARRVKMKGADSLGKKLLYRRSIVFDYFILRKKKFTDLKIR